MYGTYLFIKEPSESEWITVYIVFLEKWVNCISIASSARKI